MPSTSSRSDSDGAGVLRRYRQYLPITSATPLLYIGEGETPLVRSRRLEKVAGCEALYFKLESCNPTGSFKDRGMVMAVAKAIEEGDKAIMCASTGNTSASTISNAAVFCPSIRYGLTELTSATG